MKFMFNSGSKLVKNSVERFFIARERLCTFIDIVRETNVELPVPLIERLTLAEYFSINRSEDLRVTCAMQLLICI